MSYGSFASSHQHFVNNFSSTSEPTTYAQASKDPKWVEAMNKELLALESNKVVTKLPVGKVPIACKWLYEVKYNADGTLEW